VNMKTHDARNERIKRRYLTFLKEAKRFSESSLDGVAKAIQRFESYTRFRDFRQSHRCRGSDGRRVPAGHRRERADRRADATDTSRQQIAIGMLNDVQFGDLVKLLWWDGDGLCLFAKRLERGRFVWPRAEEGVVVLSRAQLSMLLEGIDWRMPRRTWRPELAG